jgi:phosphoribosyl 1,2-cyclic phosphodiesterase
VRVSFLGVRGSTPASGAEFLRYGGHTSSVALARDGDPRPCLILDAGTGIRRATALLGGGAFTGAILLSHLHWDHVHGLPFFAGADRDGSSVTVRLPEPADGESALDVLARGMSPPHFPINPDELRGTWVYSSMRPGEEEIEGFAVVAVEIPHGGGRTYGYRVSDGGRVVAYLPDHCPTLLGPGPDGLGEYHTAALELARDADVLVHDAFSVAEELARDAYLGHAAAEYAVELGRRAGVGRVVLFHHRPDRTDDALDALADRLGADGSVTVASEDLVLDP